MPLPEKFFFGSCFFLLGVFFASISFGIFTLVITALCCTISLFLFFGFGKRSFLSLFFLLLFIPLGSVYYAIRDEYMVRISPEKEINTTAVITKDVRVSENLQEAVVDLFSSNEKKEGRVLLRLMKFPEVHYGDVLHIEGNVEYPKNSGYAKYLEKEGISGIVVFPKLVFLGENKGSKILQTLYDIKSFSINSFKRVLPPKESAFLSGVVLGDTSGFSKEFKTAMSQSGTSHLVALSGYNIMILISAVMGMCIRIFSKKISRLIVGICIFGFVLMTGAEASVVRAALMGCILLFVGERKENDPRNLLVFVALCMVLWNPKVLTFDVGFQLSFFALLGIIYVRPVFQKIFHISSDPGIFLWRENFLSTVGAQLAVLPILISSFGNISLTALIANVCVLGFIPITMGFGFLIIFGSIFLYHISLVLGWITWVFLKFEIFVIEFFAEITSALTLPIHGGTIISYYVFLVFFVWYGMRKKENLSH
jgi:competence protein ComEC